MGSSLALSHLHCLTSVLASTPDSKQRGKGLVQCLKLVSFARLFSSAASDRLNDLFVTEAFSLLNLLLHMQLASGAQVHERELRDSKKERVHTLSVARTLRVTNKIVNFGSLSEGTLPEA